MHIGACNLFSVKKIQCLKNQGTKLHWKNSYQVRVFAKSSTQGGSAQSKKKNYKPKTPFTDTHNRNLPTQVFWEGYTLFFNETLFHNKAKSRSQSDPLMTGPTKNSWVGVMQPVSGNKSENQMQSKPNDRRRQSFGRFIFFCALFSFYQSPLSISALKRGAHS